MKDLQRWEPADEIMDLRQRMDEMFRNFFSLLPTERLEREEMTYRPAMDIYETDGEYRIEVEVPGFDPADIELTIDDNMLTVAGRREVERERSSEESVIRERRMGRFTRSLRLPSDVDPDKAQAKYERGLLKVSVPKIERAQGKRIEIEADTQTERLSEGEES